jgi:ADP-ribose pyrophosphatase YjhB (NUDIX family)
MDGEPASGAAIRMAEEEVGIKLRLAELRLAHVMHRSGNTTNEDHIDFYFFVMNFPGEVVNRHAQVWDDWKWIRWNALPPNTIPQVRYALECIKTDKVYSEFNFIN